MHSVIGLINNYGYIILFSALVLELIAFPLPGELMMTYCGFLVYQSKMNWGISILVATGGVMLGITISYFIGDKLGANFFKKYGSYIHLGPAKIEKTSKWFNASGNKLLILAYFIPGVRHITGYFSGITKISYRRFSSNAYFGALLWTATFISLGKVLGPNWDKFHGDISKYLIIGSIVISIILTIVYAYRNHRIQIIENTYKVLDKTIIIFHSMGKMKVAIGAVAVAFLGFSVLVIGVVQDYLSHEFDQFDIVVSYLVKVIFNSKWSFVIGLFKLTTSIRVLVPLTIFMFIWIIRRNINRILEIQSLFIVILGGEILQYGLRHIFRRLGPSSISLISHNQYTFPSYQALMAIVFYGFFVYLIVRHAKRVWAKTAVLIITLFICIISGLNPIFFGTEYPSDVYAGYIFGGVWLTINIILLEVYRILPTIKSKNSNFLK
ncbi:VTT domain-containing protein [Clostridium estertheticum]|uniref:VTT domain-containing protein n=1 Tax=Clostridium estertheticum TaxID=238834 RepID=A0AA47EHP4_9CLOT|nr:VTT domain-containing protein [Clostridium estertheticum]MBU3155928.1 VTT domain-containing protein [Clostridium estertheticum]MBU3200541.1 VTT domain-containing protein [Clostridium estertheticum]WAG59166.1 VTT domain-containing protein [Clostridium estertheticum]WAG66781.1 VTT domain-containing protein [Clostridium estertheticum]